MALKKLLLLAQKYGTLYLIAAKMQTHENFSKRILKGGFLKAVTADNTRLIFSVQGSFSNKFPRLLQNSVKLAIKLLIWLPGCYFYMRDQSTYLSDNGVYYV